MRQKGSLVALWLALVGAVAADTPVALTNPSMESPYLAVSENGGAISGAIANAWSDNSTWANPTAQYSEETNNPHSGTACQKLVVTSVGSGQVQFIQPFSLQAGNAYNASVWVRGTPGVQALIEVQQSASPYAVYVQGEIQLTADWQQLTATGYVGASEGAYLMVALNAPGTLWVDDFALTFAPLSISPAPRLGPVPLSFFGMHVENFLQSQLLNAGFESPYVSVGVNNPISGYIAQEWNDNSSWGVPNPTVTYAEDANDSHSGADSQKVAVETVPPGTLVQLAQGLHVIPGQVYTFTAWLRGDPGMRVNLVLQDSSPPYTYYAFTAATLIGSWQQFTAQGQVNDTGGILLMIQAPEAGTFWVDDVQITGPTGAPVSGGVPWPLTRFGTLRLWDSGTSWTSLEPQKGIWNWQPLDLWVAAAEQHGVRDILLTLGQTPAWASSNPDDVNYIGAGAPAPPTNNQDWIDYVTAVAQRYQGRIRYYEIWNEPNDPSYYSGSVAELAELTAEAYAAIKSVDPGNTVLSPAAYAPGYLDELLAAGIGSNVDMIAYHMYETPPEATGAAITNVRLVMAANGVGSMPLWDTEGASGDNTVAEDLGAAYLVRKFLVDLAFGSVRYDWYAWGQATSFCVGTEQSNPLDLTEAGRAFGLLVSWLQDASVTGASIDATGTWQIGLSWPEKPSVRSRAKLRPGAIVWNPGAPAAFAIPAGWSTVNQYDIFGNVTAVSGSQVMVSGSPVLLQAAPLPSKAEM